MSRYREFRCVVKLPGGEPEIVQLREGFEYECLDMLGEAIVTRPFDGPASQQIAFSRATPRAYEMCGPLVVIGVAATVAGASGGLRSLEQHEARQIAAQLRERCSPSCVALARTSETSAGEAVR